MSKRRSLRTLPTSDLALGVLAFRLQGVKPIDPATIPEERGTFLMGSQFLPEFARRIAREIQESVRRGDE